MAWFGKKKADIAGHPALPEGRAEFASLFTRGVYRRSATSSAADPATVSLICRSAVAVSTVLDNAAHQTARALAEERVQGALARRHTDQSAPRDQYLFICGCDGASHEHVAPAWAVKHGVCHSGGCGVKLPLEQALVGEENDSRDKFLLAWTVANCPRARQKRL